MKYIIAILLVSFLFVSACSVDDMGDDLIIDDSSSDDGAFDVDEGILPELVDPDEEIEIGEMI